MEGFYWIRISAIIAMVLGAVYALLPTFLQADLESRLAAAASQVEAPAAQVAVLEVAFDATGDTEALAEVLRRRIEVAGASVARVAHEPERVVVTLAPGGSRDTVERLATQPGIVTLYDVSAQLGEAGEQEGEEPEAPGLGPIVELVGEPVPQGWPVLEEAGDVVLDGATLALSTPLPEGTEAAAVALDGEVVGAFRSTADRPVFVPAELPSNVRALVASGPLEGSLEPAPVAAPEPTEPATVAPDDEPASRAPAWLAALLPDAKINLGLDLQGGIDLTLQVGLDEAVLGQVGRDLTYLKERAQKEGVALDEARRDRVEPVLWLTSAVDLAELQQLVRKALPEYVYYESDDNRHGFVMQDDRQEEVRKQAVEQVLETLRKRVDATGVKEPAIVKKGGGRINVQLPGMVDVQQAVEALGTTAVLEFRLVDEEFDDAVLERIVLAAEEALPPDQFQDDLLVNDWLWDTKRLDPDRMVMWEYEETPEGQLERSYPLPLKAEVILTGNDINNARVAWDQNQQPYVGLEFKPRGGQVFCEVTSANVGKRFAIILDEQIRSAPNIRERICGGSASIEMGAAVDPLDEAQTLALVLRTGALDAPVVVGQVRTVGASLGQDSIERGGVATMIGGAIVLVFMVLWYRSAGLIADAALVVNVLLVLAALAVFGATLTLPGIAGIALTIGMAVDANIIIYERIREELRLGVHPRKAVDVGFDKAVVAVLDANITTAIAAVVLFSYGTGPIKGFAVTLLIGIVTTLITALFVTRTLMELVTRSSGARLRI